MHIYNFPKPQHLTLKYINELENHLNSSDNIDLPTGYNNQIKMLQCGNILLQHLNENKLSGAFCAIYIPNIQRSSIYGGADKSLNVWKNILDIVHECLPHNSYIGRVYLGIAIHVWEPNIENNINNILKQIQIKLEKFDLYEKNQQVELHMTLTSEIGYVVYPQGTGYLTNYLPLTHFAALSTTGYDNIDCPSHIKRFSEKTYLEIQEKIKSESTLFTAIKENDFELFYQPQINLKTNKVFAAEALTVFNKYGLEETQTDTYMNIIENSKYITDFTQKSFEKLVDFLIKYENVLPQNFHIGFNLSRAIFKWEDFNFCNIVQSSLKNHPHLYKYIQIEMTESAYFSNDLYHIVFETIKRLKDLGMSIAIDDFGSGYGSLNMISSGYVNTIKLDKSTTQNLSLPNNNAFFKSLLYAAKQNSIHVIAEGVESAKIENTLLDLDIFLVQGYHYSKKISTSEFITYLDKYTMELS